MITVGTAEGNVTVTSHRPFDYTPPIRLTPQEAMDLAASLVTASINAGRTVTISPDYENWGWNGSNR